MRAIDYNGHTPAPVIPAKMAEAELYAYIEGYCAALGLAWSRRRNSMTDTSTPGFPDYVITGRGGTLFRECKTQHGTLEPAQRGWAHRLTGSGLDCALWRPADLVSGRILRELQKITKEVTT